MSRKLWWLPVWLSSPATALFLLVLGIATFLRFYNLNDSLMFLGDQGRDALIVSNIFLQHDPVFIGPVTSVGNLYLGPFYYYFMLPWLFLSYPSPIGPVLAVGSMSIFAIILFYKEVKTVFGAPTALISSVFFAFSSSVVTFSRFSWNPNIEPFFSIILLFALFRFWQEKSVRQLVWIAVAIACLLQLHYITMLILPVVGSIWLLTLKNVHKQKAQLKSFFSWSAVALGILVASLIPLILFDIKHDGLNIRGALELFQSDSFHEVAPWLERVQRIAMETHGRGMHIFFEVHIGKNRVLNSWLLFGTVVSTALLLWKLKGKQKALLQLTVFFLITTIVGLSFYTSSVFDHYILFAVPFACLVLGIIFGQIWSFRFGAGKLLVLVALTLFLVYNWPRYPLRSAGLNPAYIQKTTNEIHKLVEPNEKYNILLLSATRDSYGQNYRYFLSTDPERAPVLSEDHQTADTLIIINEERIASDPLALPIYELVVFPNKIPSEVIEIPQGPELFVLRRTLPSV